VLDREGPVRVALIAIALVACGPRVTKLNVRAETSTKSTKCLEPGMRIPIRVSAPGLGYKPSPTTYVLAASFGRFEGTTLVLPDQPLVFLQRLFISARYKENDASGSQMIRTRFCHQTVDVRASNAPVRIEVGHVPSRRHGPLALVRITQEGRTWWRLTAVLENGVSIHASGPVELFVEDNFTHRLVWLERREQPEATKIPGLGATLIAAAGGLPDEGDYDPKLDYPDPNDPHEEDGTGIQSDR
jgi:hypothetical protein